MTQGILTPRFHLLCTLHSRQGTCADEDMLCGPYLVIFLDPSSTGRRECQLLCSQITQHRAKLFFLDQTLLHEAPLTLSGSVHISCVSNRMSTLMFLCSSLPPNPDNCDFKICLYPPTRLFLLTGTVLRLVCFSKSEWPRSPVSMSSRLCTKFAPVFRIPVVPRWSLRMGTCKCRVEVLELLGFGEPLTLTHR